MSGIFSTNNLVDMNNFSVFSTCLVSVPHNLRNHDRALLTHLDCVIRELIKDFDKNAIFYTFARKLRGKSKAIVNYVDILHKIIFGQNIVGRWISDTMAIVILRVYVDYEKYVLPDDIVRSFVKIYSEYIKEIDIDYQHANPGIMCRYHISGKWNSKQKYLSLERDILENCNFVRSIRVIQDEWSYYPANDKHKTLITWLPNEMVEDTLLLLGNKNLLKFATG